MEIKLSLKYFRMIENFNMFYSFFLIFLLFDFCYTTISKIHLVVNGTGNIRILSSIFNKDPSDVIINGIPQGELCKRVCTFEEEENNVTLIFEEEISSFKYMFYGCKNIIEIDLSEFNTSNIINMASMFDNCVNLEKINFGNIDTSKVENMRSLFYNCSKLTSIDVSNFDTSQVTDMGWIFSNCSSLESLNIMNFNFSKVKEFPGFFYNCTRLSSIDVSHFDTSLTTDISWMFYGCSSLESINVSNFNTSKVENFEALFYNCFKLTSIDVSHFDTSLAIDISWMFYGCSSLKSLDITNFNTSKVETMRSLFYNCFVLTSIDLLNFDTSKVNDMAFLFYSCKSLTSLDISNFDTSNVKLMNSMFSGCDTLISLNISNFDTSNVVEMSYMFNSCNNLKSLDLTNFDTSQVASVKQMFSNCQSLIYLNLGSFNLNNDAISNFIFYGINTNLTSCINDLQIIGQLSNNNPPNCSDKCFDKNIKLDIINNGCLKSCDEKGYDYEFNNICYNECPKGTHISTHNHNLCVELSCKEFYNNKEKCFENIPEGYYFDINDIYYKPCYENCELCNGGGNEIDNNCSKCKPNLRFLNDSFYKKNCYEECPFYYYYNESNFYKCTDNYKCPQNYGKLIIEKRKCIDKCKNDNDNYIYEYNNICYKECPKGTIYNITIEMCEKNETFSEVDTIFSSQIIENEISIADNKIFSYRQKIADGSMNDLIKSIIENSEDIIDPIGNITIQITTSENMKNNKNANISTIDLGNCEEILRNIYNINYSFPLIIYKVDYKSANSLIPIIGYEIYHPLTYLKLNLSHCDNTTVSVSIPVSINEDKLYIYDPNSDYYTDSCSSYTTDNGTDIIISDRKQEYIDNNLALCEDSCHYQGYNSSYKSSECSCFAKNEIEYISNILDNPNKLSIEFGEEKSNSKSLNLFKCTNSLFSVNGLIKNISNYILAFFFFFYLFSILAFIKCGYPSLLSNINRIFEYKLKFQGNKLNHLKTKGKLNKQNLKKNKKNNFPPKKQIKLSQLNNNIKQIKNINESSRYNIGNNKLSLNKNNLFQKQNKSKTNNIKKTQSNSLKKNQLPLTKKGLLINKEIYNDYEKNTFDYMKAILYDKRTCCQYYISLLKIKNPILFAFGIIKDYNSRIIKICIFILSFTMYYAINFVFFDEKMIHKIYEDKGKYDILFFIPYISISFAITNIIIIIIKLIFLSERNIANIRNQTTLFQTNLAVTSAKKMIKIKYAFFFILGLAFIGIFWLLISSFGAVYKNTQIFIFENALLSFAISLIYPFFINILPCMFRSCSLNSKDKSCGCAYKFSKFLQIL